MEWVPKRTLSVDSDSGSVEREHNPPKRMKPSPPSRPPTIAVVKQHHEEKWLGRWQWAHNGIEPNGYVILNHSGVLETNLGAENTQANGKWWLQEDLSVRLEWQTRKGWVSHSLLMRRAHHVDEVL